MAEQEPIREPAKSGNAKRWALWIAVAVLLVVVIQNAQDVDVDFLFIHTTAPLVVLLVISAGLGFLVGWLGPRLRRDRG